MAVTAESVIVELEARTGQFDARIRQSSQVVSQSMTVVERSATDAERAVARSSDGIVRSSGAVQTATRNLGFQISDVGQQLSGGQSPFVIFGQQAPQFVQAFEEIAAAGANVGTVLRSIALPGILAVVSVLGTLIEKTLESTDADGQSRKAKVSLVDAIADLNASLTTEIASTQRALYVTQAKAQIDYEAAKAARTRAAAELAAAAAAARAEDARARNTSGLSGQRGEVASLAGADNRFASRAADLERRAAAAEVAVKQGARAVTLARASIIQTQVAEATDASARATGRFERRQDALNAQLKRGQINLGQYRSELERATKVRDDALDAAREAGRGSGRAGRMRTARTAGGTSAAAINSTSDLLADLRRDLDATEKQFDRLFINGRSDLDRSRDRFRQIFGDGDPLGQAVKDADRERDIRLDAATQAENMAQSVREGNIRSLANIYEDLFTQGSARAWDNFKRDGLRTIALVLAQATITSFAKGGGGFGSLLGNIFKGVQSFGGIPGFAGGGTMVIGGNAGVDSNLLSLNGRPIAAVSRGESLSISPNGRAASPQSGTGGVTIVSSPQFNLRGAVVTQELYADMQRISAQSAAQARDQAVSIARRGLPSAQTRFGQLGTTG